MTAQAEARNCDIRARLPLGARIVAWLPTLIASAALFSLFFVGDESLLWLGVLGFVPLGLRLAGCPTCGGARQAPTLTPWL